LPIMHAAHAVRLAKRALRVRVRVGRLMLKARPEHDPEKWAPVFRKIMLKQRA
jgi:hypothetical protein